MTGSASLYDLSAPEEEEREGSFSLARAGTGRSPLADAPPLPEDPGAALLDRARKAPAVAGEFGKGLNSSLISLEQGLTAGLPVLVRAGESKHHDQQLADYDAIDAGETPEPRSARASYNRIYAAGGPETRAMLRERAQKAQGSARSAIGERTAAHGRLEEEKALWAPRVPGASSIESLSDVPDYLKGLAGSAVPSLALGFGAGALAGRGAAALTALPTQIGESMSEGIRRGDPAAMAPYALATGPLAAGAERFGVPARYFGPGAGKTAAKAFLGEAGAETAQTALGQVAKAGAYGDPLLTRENLVELGDAAIGGGITGTGVHGFYSAAPGGTQLPPLKTPQDMRAPPPETPASPGETMFKRADPSPPGTHSALRKTFDEAPFEEGTAKQWAEFLRSRINKGGLKPAELEQAQIWPLLESAQEIPLTKDAIIDHLDSKAVKLKVRDRGAGYSMRDNPEDANEGTRWHYDASRAPGDQQTTPGGGEAGTYGEFIITAPEMTKTTPVLRATPEQLAQWMVVRPDSSSSDQLRIAIRRQGVAETQMNQLDHRIRTMVDNDIPIPDDLNRERAAAYDRMSAAIIEVERATAKARTHVKDENGVVQWTLLPNVLDHAKTDAQLIETAADRNYRAASLDASRKNDYTHSHWPEVKNPIAHGRYDQRADPEGNAYFVLQEGQSDIHQDAQARRLQKISRLVRDEGMDRAEASKKVPRDFGYETAAKKQAREEANAAYKAATDAWAAATDAWDADPSQENDDRRRALYVAKQEASTRVNELTPMGKPLPDAPFKDWMPLVLKTALAKAVKQGLSRFAWTTGDAQNQRNQLSTKIRELRYHVAPDGKYEIEAFPLDHDDRTPVTMTVHPAELTEAVGKDITGRIQAQEGEVVGDDVAQSPKRSLKGEGLEMKGDGKRQIYDVMVKNELERIGRKWGVKTKSVMLPAGPIGGRAGEDDDGNSGEGPRYEIKVAGPSFGRAKLDNVPGATFRIFDNDNSKTVELFPTREEAENALRQKYTEHEPYHYIDIPPEMAKMIAGEGVPLYKRSGKEAGTEAGQRLTHDLEAIYERTPEYEEKRQQVEDEAKALLKTIAPGVDLTVADKLIAEIDGKREEVMGAYYTPALDGNVIDHMVAISMRSDDWQATLNHEVVHFLKRAGYISNDEWSVLQKKAEGKGLDKREHARMNDLRERGELNASEKKELAGLENKASWIQRFDVEKLYPGRKDIWAEEAVAKAKEAFSRGELKPGTFIAKVFDRISQFFDQLGVRLDALGLVSPQQVFRRIDSGEVGSRTSAKGATSETVQQRTSKPPAKTDAHRLSNIDILRGDEVEERAPGSRTKSQVGFELNERAKKLLAKLKIPAGDLSNPKLIEIMSDAIADEIVAAYKASGNASGWYSSTLVEAMKIATIMHPELETDPAARVSFLLAMSITSQNMDVKANLMLADRQYAAYKKTGKFPLVGQGTASGSMAKNFAKANALMEEYSPEQVERFLNTKFTAGELKQAGWTVDENVDQEVYGSAIFGPKIGNGFYQNLSGNFDPLTMDMWFMRGMGRLSGNLMPGDPVLAAKQRKRLLEALRDEKVGKDGREIDWYALKPRPEEGEELGIDRFTPASVRKNDDILMEFAHRIVSWHNSDYKENRAGYDNKTLIKPDVVQAAKRLLEQGATNDQPGSGGRRIQLRHIFRTALEKARGDITGLTTADGQAIWWYPEKDLYKRLGYRAKRAEPTDYAKEMAALAREKGIDDVEIDRARDRGRGGDDAGGAEGGGERSRPAYGKSERQEFLTARVLAKLGGKDPGRLVYERRTGNAAKHRPLVAGRAVTPVQTFGLPQTTANAFRAIGISAPDIHELPAGTAAPDFHAAILDAKGAHPRGEAVYAYAPEDYAKMRLFTTADGKAGFALKGDDIVSVFNSDPSVKAWALTALMLATQQGGRRLDAFDVGLPRAYSQAGFRAVSRIPWSDPDKPAGWDKKAFARFNNGEPDVVFMKYDPSYGKLYEPGDGKRFTGPDAYDDAVKMQGSK